MSGPVIIDSELYGPELVLVNQDDVHVRVSCNAFGHVLARHVRVVDARNADRSFFYWNLGDIRDGIEISDVVTQTVFNTILNAIELVHNGRFREEWGRTYAGSPR